MKTWDHKEEWHRYGEHYLIVVKRYSVGKSLFDPFKGPQRWAVYAYIYPEHRLFNDFEGDSIWQPATTVLPLHGGASFLRWHYDRGGKPTSVQVGADYDHLDDGRFSHCETIEDAAEVFEDAERLFNHLAPVEDLK